MNLGLVGAAMEITQLKPIVESLILVSEEPISVGEIQKLLEEDGVTKGEVEEAIRLVKEKYEQDMEHGIQVREVAGGYQICTKPELSMWIQRLNAGKPIRLSQAAMETLAIVAYRQPVVRAEIENIRGVDTGGVLKTLLERGLIRIIGRREEVGNPLIYGTTPQFLENFDLPSLQDLPSLKDYQELERERTGTVAQQAEGQVEDRFKIGEDEVFDPTHEDWEDEEQRGIINDLEDGLKNLRRLETEIFPKEKTQESANPNADLGGANVPTGGSESEEQTANDVTLPIEPEESQPAAADAKDDAFAEDDRTNN